MSVMGIDLGTSAAVMCHVKAGAVDTVINEASKRKSPALVSFHNGQRYIGEPAVALTSSNYKNTLTEVRRMVGRTWSDPETQRDIARFANSARYKAMANGSVGVEVDHGSETLVLDATSALAMWLAGLKRTAERTLSESGTPVAVKDCVLSVPTYYSDVQRRAVLDAGKVAGLNVLRLLNTTSAVALDYGMWKNARNVFDAEKRTLVLFVDTGYADTHVALASYTKGKVEILATASDRELGGRDIDAALVERFAAEFEKKTKLNPRKEAKAMIKLGAAAEKAKQTLTPEGVTKAEVYVEYLMNETDLRTVLTTEDLDVVLAPLVARIPPLVQRVLEQAAVQQAELHSVEMVGGTSRIRAFKRTVGAALGLDASKPPNFGVLTTLNADESVGRGCALSCAMLSPQFKIAAQIEVLEHVSLPIQLQWEQKPAEPTASSGGGGGGGEDGGDAMDVVAAASSNSLVLFTAVDLVPRTRRVTFRRNEQFTIEASYDDRIPDSALPKAAPRHLLSAVVSGMPSNAATKGSIAVEFTLNKSGVFSASKAEFMETVEEEGKRKTARSQITLAVKHHGATDAELASMLTREADLQAKDRALRERADKRNALEEFIYRSRDALDAELKPFATEAEASKMREQVEKEEAWLYDHGDDASASEFDHKLAALRSSYDRIADRMLQREERAKAAERLSQAVQSLLQVANSTSDEFAHLSDEERNTVRTECDAALGWLHGQMAKQAAAPANVDPVLTAAMIDDKTSALKNKCRPITTKPKPTPPPKATTPVPPTSAPPPPPASEDANGSGAGAEKKDDAGAEKKKKDETDMDLD